MEQVTGPTEFVADIDLDNEASQKLFRMLGFMSYGIDTPIFKDQKFLAEFEDRTSAS